MAVSVRGQRVFSPFANVVAGALVAPTGLPGGVLGIGIPVSLSNGGTGVSASSNAQLLDEIGAVPRSGGSMSGNLTVSGWILAGAPTAPPVGGMADGAINAQAIYINGDPVGVGGGLSTSGGTVTGLVTINGGASSTPLTIQTNSGVPAEIRFDNATAYQWSVGPGGAGVFRIADNSGVLTGPPARITIDGATGEVGIVHNLQVEGNVQFDGDLNVVGDIVGGTVTPSDRRLKKNIKPWSCGLEAVKRLKPISYEYNGRGGLLADGRMRVGLDASATQKVIPEMVKNSSHGLDGKPLKMIHPDTVTYALINAVTELANRLEALERR